MCTEFLVCIVFRLARRRATNKYINKEINTYTSENRNILDRLLPSRGFWYLSFPGSQLRKSYVFTIRNLSIIYSLNQTHKLYSFLKLSVSTLILDFYFHIFWREDNTDNRSFTINLKDGQLSKLPNTYTLAKLLMKCGQAIGQESQNI